jgi:hypothetical protein
MERSVRAGIARKTLLALGQGKRLWGNNARWRELDDLPPAASHHWRLTRRGIIPACR